MLIDRFLEGKPKEMGEITYTVQMIIMDAHPAITQAWKWNTLCFMLGKKVIAYFGTKKGMFQIGFWNKAVLSSALVQRELKQIGYYLIDELTEELLADIMMSAEETVKASK